MKRQDIYVRKQEEFVKDKVISLFREEYLEIGGNINYPTECETFLNVFRGGTSVIKYQTALNSCEGKYDQITIETMPQKTEVPKELSDFLKEKGFKKN